MGCATSKQQQDIKKAVPRTRPEPTERVEQTARTYLSFSESSERSYSNKTIPTAMMISATGEVSPIERASKPDKRCWASSRKYAMKHRRAESKATSGAQPASERSSVLGRSTTAASFRVRCNGVSLAEALDQLENNDGDFSDRTSPSSCSGEFDPGGVCLVEMTYSSGTGGKCRHGRKRQRRLGRRDKRQFVVLRQQRPTTTSIREEAMAAVTREQEQEQQRARCDRGSLSNGNTMPQRKGTIEVQRKKRDPMPASVTAAHPRRNPTTPDASCHSRRRTTSSSRCHRNSKDDPEMRSKRRLSSSEPASVVAAQQLMLVPDRWHRNPVTVKAATATSPANPLDSSLRLESIMQMSAQLLMFEDSSKSFDLPPELFRSSTTSRETNLLS